MNKLFPMALAVASLLQVALATGCQSGGSPAEPAPAGIPPFDPSRGSLVATPAVLVADGSAAATVTVTLRLATGDPAPGKAVRLTTSVPDARVRVLSGTTNAKGEATFAVTSTVVDQVVLTADCLTDGSRPLQRNATLAFHSPAGFFRDGTHKDTGTPFDPRGFDAAGFNAAGINAAGFNRAGFHTATGTRFDPAGYDLAGVNALGFTAAGTHHATGTPYDPAGYDARGFDAAGRNAGGHARSVLAPYAHSQAEALRIGYGIRAGDPAPSDRWEFDPVTRWITRVPLGLRNLDTGTYAMDRELAFEVESASLARRIAAALEIPFGVHDALSGYEVNQLLPDDLRSDLFAATPEGFNPIPTVFVRAPRFFPRLFAVDPLNADQAAYQQYLLTEADRRASALGLAHPSPDPYACAHVAPDGAAPEREFMRGLLEAIANHDDRRFIENLARFANVWGARHEGARLTFRECMTTLYVAKRFPSRATMSTLFHFILNCGRIHT